METSLLGRPTFGGLATGLDTNALLEGLLALERMPLQRLQSRRAEIDNQRSLMHTLNTKLMALRDAARAIDNRNPAGTDNSVDEEFLKYEGSTTNDKVLTVSAGSGAAPGEIEIEVVQLARGSRRFSEELTAAQADVALLAGQTITIDLPNGDPDAQPEPVEATHIVIEADEGVDLSLQDIRDQINTSAENGGTVRADVLQVSDDQFRLVLTSTETGAENEISVSGGLAMTDLGDESNNNAQSSQIRLFGQLITRETNAIDDVLSGITLRLVDEAEVDEVTGENIVETVTVGVDTDEVAKSLDDFVKAYNEVVSFIDGQFRYNESSKTAGPLSGDYMLRDVQRQLRQMVSTGFSFETNPNNPFGPGEQGGTISGIGLEIVDGGRLRVNKETLDEALALDPGSVREFLHGRLRETPANQDEIPERAPLGLLVISPYYRWCGKRSLMLRAYPTTLCYSSSVLIV